MATVADITNVRLSGLTYIDALLDSTPGWNWLAPARNVIYYSFSLTGGETNNLGISGGLTAFNASQQSACVTQLNYISQLTGIEFVAVANGSSADLHFANTNIISGASISGLCSSGFRYSYDSSNTIASYGASAYVYLDNVEWAAANTNPTAGSSGYETLLHELGHALGLKHPFEGTTLLPAAQDNTANTLMSYTSSGGPYSSFSAYDVAALMWIYGGDGLGGALGSSSAGAYLMGNSANNVLGGGSGNDKLEGSAGNDLLDGGSGTDTAVFGGVRASYALTKADAGYTVTSVRGTDGTDSVTHVERLAFADRKLAIDMGTGDAGGKAALLIGAVLGKSGLAAPATVRDVLAFFDTGASLHDGAEVLVRTGVMDSLAGGTSTDAYVNLIYHADIGQTPTPTMTAELAAYIQTGGYTKADFLTTVAALAVNQSNVDLIGLQQTGMAYA